MPLQEFVKQINDVQPEAVGYEADDLAQASAKSAGRAVQLAGKASHDPVAELAQSASAGFGKHHSDPVLNTEDRDILRALAAAQIRYGRPSEAVPYLMMLRKTDEQDRESSRLLALAFMKLGHWKQAEVILETISAQSLPDQDPKLNSITALYRGIVAFKQRKVIEARSWLQRVRNSVTGLHQ
jgi:hypothetical protein